MASETPYQENLNQIPIKFTRSAYYSILKVEYLKKASPHHFHFNQKSVVFNIYNLYLL